MCLAMYPPNKIPAPKIVRAGINVIRLFLSVGVRWSGHRETHQRRDEERDADDVRGGHALKFAIEQRAETVLRARKSAPRFAVADDVNSPV